MSFFHQMNWLDGVLLIIMVASIGLGIWSGFILQVFNVLSLILSILAAGHYGPRLAEVFGEMFGASGAWDVVAAILIFLVLIIGLRLLALLLRGIIKKLRFGAWDRILGGVFGGIKGFLLCAVLFMIAMQAERGTVREAADESRLMPYVARTVEGVKVLCAKENREKARNFLEKQRSRVAGAKERVMKK